MNALKPMIKRTISLMASDFKVQQSGLAFFYRAYEESVFAGLIARGHRTVLSGPFKGMKVQETESGKNFRTTHLLGTFETCLNQPIMNLAAKTKRLINIGCGSGYYTNGLAFHYKDSRPDMSVSGYDIDKSQIERANGLARYNGLTNVMHHAITPDFDYRAVCEQGGLAIIDIEGAEYDLLTGQKQAFLNCDMLIEIHSHNNIDFDGGIKILSDLYKDTHTASVIEETKSVPFDLYPLLAPSLGHLGYLGMHLLVCENRKVPMKWLVLEKRAA
ncbi:MAG TPA: methyltransferase domain-containing protein [Micavibrio sp.]|nr:methyltransferase domain-containing protein [Micavibrio sp.]